MGNNPNLSMGIFERLKAIERIDKNLDEEMQRLARYKSDSSLNPKLGPICQSFDALRSVDRLARLVAVLNWYKRISKRDLPSLPSFVVPVSEKVPASWRYDAVLAKRRVK